MFSARATENFREWLKLGRRRDLGTWEMIPSEVNAYFNPPENSLVFPAGILQPPFFGKDWYVQSPLERNVKVVNQPKGHFICNMARLALLPPTNLQCV